MAEVRDYPSVRWNLARLRAANREGYTQHELAREIYQGAKETGDDIQQVRGRRRATERFDFATGQWVKVGASSR